MKKLLQNTETAILLPFAVLLTAFAFSLYFAHERILNTDNSNYFFNIINSEWFWTAEKRYAVYVTQLPVILALKLHAPLNFLVHLYSVSFVLLYLVIAFIILFLLHYKHGLIMLSMALFLGLNYSFFHPVTETHQAIAYGILFFSAMNAKDTYHNLRIATATISFFLSLLAHPVAVFILAFAIVWHMLCSKQYKNIYLWIAVAGLGVFAILRSRLNQNNYDAVQYQNLYQSLKNIRHVYSWYSSNFLIQHYEIYVWPLLFWMASAVLYLKNRSTLQFFSLIIFPAVFLILSLATFSAGDSQMMMEKSFMPAFAMISIASAEYIFRFKALTISAVIFFVFCFFMINNTGNKVFGKRLEAFDKFIIHAEQAQDKYLACIDDAPEVWRNYWWATSIDMLVRSIAKHNRTITLYLHLPDENLTHAAKPESFMYVNWWPAWEVNFLNKKFFTLSHKPYQTIKLTDYE